MFYKTDFGVFKFKSPLLNQNSIFKNQMIFFEIFNTHINRLTKNSLINMTLQCHYINIFEKIDSFFGCLTLFLACLNVIAPT
jgi:hypothetical protein